jgi:hypothetical protein
LIYSCHWLRFDIGPVDIKWSSASDDDSRHGVDRPVLFMAGRVSYHMSTCGKGSLYREHPTKAGSFQFLRGTCRKFTCLDCGPKKKKLYRKAIFAARAEYRLQRHMILTLDPGLIPADVDSLVYLQQVWSRFRTWLFTHRQLKLQFIRTIELQSNGTAHFHVLLHETLAQDTIIKAWVECGGGHQCRIRFRDGNRAAAYVTKYITKAIVTELRSGSRRVATSQGITLFPAKLPSGWSYSPVSFVFQIEYTFGLSFMEAHLCQISDYFEAESPPLVQLPIQTDRELARLCPRANASLATA